MGRDGVLLVDDITSGGRKIMDYIDALRRLGCSVSECWVLYESLRKDAYCKPKAKAVNLSAIVSLDGKAIAELKADMPE